MPTVCRLVFFLVVLGVAAGTWAQAGAAPQTSPAPTPSKPLSKGFDELKLGMDYQAVSEVLKKSTSFRYRGDPDVSLSPDGKEKIIETKGGFYVRRAVFQFLNDKLFAITLDLEPAQFDWYMLYTTLTASYGEPQGFEPRQALWDDGTVRLQLEKPLTVKYLAVEIMNSKLNQAGVQKALQEDTRDAFLKKL